MTELPRRREHASPGTGLHRLAGWLWNALVLLVVLLALYLSVGRYAFGRVGDAREWLLDALNAQLPFTVQVARLGGAWSAFSPELRFEGLELQQSGGAPVRVAAGHLRLDVFASLARRSLQLSRLELSGVSLQARITADGALELEGFEAGGGALQDWLRDFLPQVERVALREHRLLLRTVGGEQLLRVDLGLERAGNARLLQARVAAEGLQVALRADGVGNPLRPLSWAGDVYMEFRGDDLRRLRPLWEGLDWPFRASGAASAQFWLRRSGGDSRAQLRVRGGAVHIEERDGAWDLPLDALSFAAALEQRGDRWSLRADELHAERAGSALDLARAQFDWRRRALRVRAEDLHLDSLPTLLASAPGLPPALREALPALAPSGRLRAVELRFDDLAAPADTWSLRGGLDGLAVKSWRGAPALRGVSGFLELGPGGGQLRLDSGAFSMHFPTVYRDPLAYDSAQGDIALDWDADGLRLRSGLLTVSGPEGRGRGRFALDIPFAPRVTGVEMDLLVSLDDSTLDYGDKYLPYRLPRPLLDWVGRSVEGGRVRRGAFIWRGSLRPRNHPHLTVQLFLDVARAQLRYHREWPRLRDLDASLWVDNGEAWAVARSGRILDTDLSGLALRIARGRDGPRLALRGDLGGDALDAQRLLADSALAALTGRAFTQWRLAGPVAGTLALELALADNPPPPRVDLALDLAGVDADISALALPLRDIRGELRYRSGSGFAGSALRGLLWGAPVRARARPAAPGVEDLALEGRVDAAALADWLELPLLEFADGESPVTGELRVEREGPAALTLSSDLVGVALDAPRPFAKPAAQALPLQLQLPLRADPRLALSLGERLDVQLDFGAGGLRRLAATVGGDAAPPPDCDARFCLGGTLSQLDLLEWRDFHARYLRPGGADPAATGAATYRIDSLTLGDLRIGERRLGGARLDLWGRGTQWQGALEASWAQGSLTREEGRLQLLVEYLESDRFDGGDGSGLPADLRPLLPDMRVDILDLRRDGRSIGFLGFDLDGAGNGDGLQAAGIDGELFGVDLAPRQPGLLAWTGSGAGESTALELDVAFEDLDQVLESAGYAPTLEARRGSAALRLRWPGSPLDYRLEAARGALRVNLRDGQILESRPDALALVSLLNFAEIVRRLSLTHMFETGIPFEKASSDLRLHAGRVEIADLHIDGAASAFAFTGSSDLGSGAIDGELVVTLPVADNLPWVAALAGGPAVAAGVFVVSKVFEKQVKRMSSAVYGVSGSIDAPEVSFRRLFDDRPSSPAPLPDPAGSEPGTAAGQPAQSVP